MRADQAPFDPRRTRPLVITRPVEIDPRGLTGPTRGQAAGPRWRRVAHRLYVPAHIDPWTPEQRAAEALTPLPDHAAVTGWAALWLAGAAYFDGRRWDGSAKPVPLAIGPGPGRRARVGTSLSYEDLPDREVVTTYGIASTAASRALFDELRTPPFDRGATVAADMALAAGVVDREAMLRYVAEHSRWRRSSWAETAMMHSSARSRSPTETRLRLIWTLDAGLPPPLVNQPVFTLDGELVCIADLFDAEAGLVVEYDGAEHRAARRHASDVARTERIREVQLELTTVTGPDLARRDLVARRLVQARRRARFASGPERRWTLSEPPGWTSPLGLPTPRRSA